jgi:hypothetical protein
MLSFLHRASSPRQSGCPPDARRMPAGLVGPCSRGLVPLAARSVARVTEAGREPAGDRLETPGSLARRGLRSPSDDRPPTRIHGHRPGRRGRAGREVDRRSLSPLAVEWMGHERQTARLRAIHGPAFVNRGTSLARCHRMLSEIARKRWIRGRKTVQRGDRIVYRSAKVVFCSIRVGAANAATRDFLGD